ncbi:probable endo-1,4-beta-xylanase [Phialocephala subalpina]|uniref:Beta-xylanase n=1 Tax=Phialocephala subalpina TaxID=576137 RepID=A0A1L7XJ71_9HELO|nr:probable endo-1,4-beta-xylanase [Phialocephala subalpina]
MHSFSFTAAAATLALLQSAASALATGGPYLNQLAKQQGKLWFGTAADIPQTNDAVEQFDTAYLSILTNPNIFGEMTPANVMKFMYVEPEQNVFNFTGGDYFLNLAEKSGAKVRCHNLVWATQISPFLTAQNWTADSLTAVMENHIKTTIKHFSDRCYSWDVINEALNGDGTFSSSIWYDTIGPDYFYLAYKFAMEAVRDTGKDIKLYYNDYGIESLGNKTTALLGLVKHLQHRHIQIDGIGFESHFEVGGTPSTADQLASMKSFLAMGLDVAQTELDVRFTGPPFYSAAGQAQQARDYYSSVAACMQAGRRCIGTTVWDFDDKYSWVPGAFAGQGGADIYNATLERKPAYYAIADAIQGNPCSVC